MCIRDRCSTEGTKDFGGGSVVVFGRVKLVAIDEAVLTDGRPDIHKLAPLARLGGPTDWSEIGEILRISRIDPDDWPGHYGD